jgi:hypothetical protein
VVSSTFHLTTSNNHHVGITECKKLKCIIWRSGLRHNVHTKFHEYPSSHSVIIKISQTDKITEVGLDWVGLSDAQRIVPTQESQHSLHWYCLLYEFKIWYFGLALNSIKCTLNFLKIPSSIPDLLCSQKYSS